MNKNQNNEILFTLAWKIMIQSGNNFAYTTIAYHLWYMHNSDLTGSLNLKLYQDKFLQVFNHKLINHLLRQICKAHSCHVNQHISGYLSPSWRAHQTLILYNNPLICVHWLWEVKPGLIRSYCIIYWLAYVSISCTIMDYMKLYPKIEHSLKRKCCNFDKISVNWLQRKF